jgi:hypothetical protein
MVEYKPNLDVANITVNSDIPLMLPLCHPLTRSALVVNSLALVSVFAESFVCSVCWRRSMQRQASNGARMDRCTVTSLVRSCC